LSVEEVRILRAAGEGRLSVTDTGRYVIAQEDRPDRRARQRLQRQQLIGVPSGAVSLTEEGEAYLSLLDSGS
jgi:hypothetical protein